MQNGFEEYKPIRNRLRKWRPDSIVETAIVKLFEISAKKATEWRGYTPWDILLVIKWTFADWKNMKAPDPISINGFNGIVNMVKDYVANSTKIIKSKNPYSIEKFMRQTAFQQFWFQEKLGKRELGRTVELFLNLPCKFNLDKALGDKLGLSKEEFIELALLFWGSTTSMNSTKPYVEIGYFSNVAKAYGGEKLKSFMQVISHDIISAIYMCEEAIEKDFIRQAYEQTLFRYKPFLFVNDKFFLIYKGLVDQYLKFGIYDYCKDEFGSDFTTSFGDTFEKYISDRLDEYHVDYLRERDLKYFGFNSQVDYIIRCETGNILIEVKAKEATDYVKEVPLSEALVSGYKDSIIKGVYQAQKVLNDNKFESIGLNTEKNFILIVTYKDLYLGHFLTAWNEFIRDGLTKHYSNFDVDSVDVDQFNIISVDELDRFLCLFEGDGNNMLKKLDEITIHNKEVGTAKYLFSMHLDKKKLRSSKKMSIDKNFDIVFSTLCYEQKNPKSFNSCCWIWYQISPTN